MRPRTKKQQQEQLSRQRLAGFALTGAGAEAAADLLSDVAADAAGCATLGAEHDTAGFAGVCASRVHGYRWRHRPTAAAAKSEVGSSS